MVSHNGDDRVLMLLSVYFDSMSDEIYIVYDLDRRESVLERRRSREDRERRERRERMADERISEVSCDVIDEDSLLGYI